MFPNVNTEKWDMWRGDRVLVSGGDNFKTLVLRVES